MNQQGMTRQDVANRDRTHQSSGHPLRLRRTFTALSIMKP